MDRAEAAGVGVATMGHLALLAALTFGFANAVRLPTVNPPMEVSFVDEVGLDNASPDPATEPAALAQAPEIGPPEDAAPAPLPTAQPAPLVEAAPAPPPTPNPKPAPKAAPKQSPVKAAKPTPPKPAPAGKGKAEQARGSRLGKDFLKGLGSEPAAKSTKAPGAVMSAQAMSGIVSAIRRQIQPCADRQVNPGPGANRISVKINLKLNRDGSLGGRPRVLGTTGVDDENSRYEKRVSDLAIAAFTGCAPLRGLPADLYDTARGGWNNFNMNYKLPG